MIGPGSDKNVTWDRVTNIFDILRHFLDPTKETIYLFRNFFGYDIMKEKLLTGAKGNQ